MPETNPTKPKVSVVLPAYNEELNLEDTLRSLASQDYPDEYEVVVCDNASTDRTSEIAAKMGAKVVSEKRKGTRFAYDTAMRAASGDLILITNADVRLPANWISRIVAEYDDPEVVGVGTKVKFYNAPGWVNFFLETMDKLSPKHAMWGPSMSCRREAFYKVGGFNHGVNTNEDAIFTLLIEKLGKVKIIDLVSETDGRRFNNGFFSAVKAWMKSYGLNSMYIQFHYLLTGEIKTWIRDFGDFRSATFGQGEKVQISVIIPVSNEQEYISSVLSDLENQDFNLRFRVYVLNDTSTDLTLQIARLFPDVTTVAYPGVYDLSSKLRTLCADIPSPVIAITSARARLPQDWLGEIYLQFNKDRKKQLQVLSGPYVNEYNKLLSAVTNQTLDRMSTRMEFYNLALLTNVAKDAFAGKGNAETIIANLEKLVASDDDGVVNYAPNFRATYSDKAAIASFLTTSATSVKHTLRKLFNL